MTILVLEQSVVGSTQRSVGQLADENKFVQNPLKNATSPMAWIGFEMKPLWQQKVNNSRTRALKNTFITLTVGWSHDSEDELHEQTHFSIRTCNATVKGLQQPRPCFINTDLKFDLSCNSPIKFKFKITSNETGSRSWIDLYKMNPGKLWLCTSFMWSNLNLSTGIKHYYKVSDLSQMNQATLHWTATSLFKCP